jgi:hypothetical protein
MTQLNLLPDVKLDFIKAQRMRRLILSVSVLVTVVAVVILLLMLIIDFAQKKHISDLNSTINSETQSLEHEHDISKIMTVQSQLESLTALHSAKPAVSRLFTNYLDETTPAKVDLSNFTADFNAHTFTITGSADSLITVNQYVDTLKFTKFTVSGSSASTDAFSDVVLTSFGINSNAADPSQAASFTINLNFDPTIFNITDNVTLTVPNIITTRSELDQPSDLFKTVTTASTSSGGQ